MIDHHHAANLRAAISAAAMCRPAPRRIVLDLRPVTSVDDLGLATLIVAGRICRDAGIDLTIRHPSPLVRQLPGRSGQARRGGPWHPAGDRAGRHTEPREPSR